MPLLRFDVIEGRSEEELKTLLDTAHDAMVEAFDVPAIAIKSCIRIKRMRWSFKIQVSDLNGVKISFLSV